MLLPLVIEVIEKQWPYTTYLPQCHHRWARAENPELWPSRIVGIRMQIGCYSEIAAMEPLLFFSDLYEWNNKFLLWGW